jgi:hypothetical protein
MKLMDLIEGLKIIFDNTLQDVPRLGGADHDKVYVCTHDDVRLTPELYAKLTDLGFTADDDGWMFFC